MLVAGINIFISLSCRCLTQEDRGRHYFETRTASYLKTLSLVSICFQMTLLGVVIFFFPPQVKGMDLAPLTQEAAIQGTEVGLGMPFILGPVNMFLLMSYA